MEHVSVMLDEVLEILNPGPGEIFFDGTFGAGGYSKAILNCTGTSVIACDRDPLVIPFSKNVENFFAGRFKFFHSKFSDIENILNQKEFLDGIVLDLGISNLQLQDESRGFSFFSESSLNMEMGLCEESVMDVLKNYSEKNLADIIYKYGEETRSRKIAKSIKLYLKNIRSSRDLAEVVFKAVGKNSKIHPATKTFQALRIFVNKELYELEKFLNFAPNLLKKNGKIVIVSFHSLEDRIVKLKFKSLKNEFEILTKKPKTPSEKEIKSNFKSRSAKLRAAKKSF